MDKLPSLRIGDLSIDPPIIQGGMGVRVSGASLAAAVSREGALGVIAAVGLGEEDQDASQNYNQRSEAGLRDMIRRARAATKNPVGVNIMCVLTNYENLVRAAADEGVSAIISGAGLPMKLPEMVENPSVKLIPIVSSARAADLICKTWLRRYHRLPDAVVVEGPLAGGHLGFPMEQALHPEHAPLERLVTEVISAVNMHKTGIPVIAAGGVYDGKDIARFLKLGASGVQMATRFVCTHECDAAPEFKQAYLNCNKGDITVIKSPVGLPGRVVKNKFVERILSGEMVPFECKYKCLLTCNPAEAPYCIAKALVNAYRGKMDEGFAMCGANAHRISQIVSVKELIDSLVGETLAALQA